MHTHTQSIIYVCGARNFYLLIIFYSTLSNYKLNKQTNKQTKIEKNQFSHQSEENFIF